MRTIGQVCVYCASSQKVDRKYFAATERLADAMVGEDITAIYGGGAVGLMGALADRMLAGGGHVIGVIPDFMKMVEWDHKGVTQLEVVDDMHQRKRRFFEGTDGIVALAGGCGTLEELLEAITWKRLGLITCPIIILNTDGYYDPLIAMLDRCVDERFLNPDHRSMWTVVNEPEQVLPAIRDAAPWSEDAIHSAKVE